MQESRMPATVKVPPMMAQICKRVREQSMSEIGAEEALGCPPPASQEDEFMREATHYPRYSFRHAYQLLEGPDELSE